MTAMYQYQPYARKALALAQISCFWLLRILGWAAVCTACVVSLNVLFFVMLGNFTVEGLLYQLENFGSRYVAADSVRRAEFATTWLVANIALFSFVGLFRRHSLFSHSSKMKEA